MPHNNDLIFTNNNIEDNSITFDKLPQVSTNIFLGRNVTTSGSIEQITSMSIENLPIGSLIARYMTNFIADTPSRINDWRSLYNFYIPLDNLKVRILKTTYPLLQGTVATKIREALSYNHNNKTWQVYSGYSHFAETSNSGSTFNSIEPYRFNYNLTLSSNNYYCNFQSSSVVIGIFKNCTSYVYSNDMINYTKVDTTSNLMTPVVSSNVYSFWNSTTSQRVYTTNHTSFTNSTNWFGADRLIFKMSNNSLYAANGTMLKISTNNGINWTSYTLPANVPANNIHCVDTNGSIYVFGSTTNTLWSSTDLVTWTPRSSNIPGTNTNSRIYNTNGTFFVFSDTAGISSFSTSTDGITWNNRTWSDVASLIGQDVKYVNNLYMISTNTQIQVSSNLASWTSSISVGNTNINSSEQFFYGSGSNASIISSSNWYFYNSGVWTTIASNQGLETVETIINQNDSCTYLKVR
jgi:hypothetical protein